MPRSLTIAAFAEHADRGAVLAEMHARPFEPLGQVGRVVAYAFLTDNRSADADRAALARFCRERGVDGPRPGHKHHRANFGAIRLRWEQHSEFATYNWEVVGRGEQPFASAPTKLADAMHQIGAPGPLVVAVDLAIVDGETPADLPALFDTTSLAVSSVADGQAVVATDFRADPSGYVRILVRNLGLNDRQLGLTIQSVLEIEIYRAFTLLGLTEARRQWPIADRIERALMEETSAIRADSTRDLETDQKRLDALTALAAELEATAVASNFRFAASDAYEAIVRDRLKALGGRADQGFPSIESFLVKRLTPAVRTVRAIRDRQADLSRRLARAVNLLRTHVDVQLEAQNRELLRSMNERTRLQLRLQQTVEGLSVAAISYYIIGLLGYLLKSLSMLPNIRFDPVLLTGLLVVPVVFAVAWLARRIREKHVADEDREHSPW